MAFVEAHALADVLTQTSDPLDRARRYHRSVHRLLRPHFDFCVAADKGFLARAKMARGDAVSLLDRFLSKMYVSVLAPALEEKPVVSKEWLKAQQMREVSPPWVALLFLLYTLLLWALRTLRGVEYKPPAVAPSRDDMLRAVSAMRPNGSSQTTSAGAQVSNPGSPGATEPAPASDPVPTLPSSVH